MPAPASMTKTTAALPVIKSMKVSNHHGSRVCLLMIVRVFTTIMPMMANARAWSYATTRFGGSVISQATLFDPYFKWSIETVSVSQSKNGANL